MMGGLVFYPIQPAPDGDPHAIPPGHYRIKLRNHKPVVIVACPECSKMGALLDHHVKPNGEVWPSVVCAHGCGWHVYVRLEGWPNVDLKTS
jgi:hypothetical protein